MKKLVLVLIFFLGTAQAEVYRWVDEDGTIIFSDEPQSGSEKIELSPTTIYTPEESAISSTPKVDKPPVADVIPTYSVTIISPSNNEAIWSNNGQVSISVLVEPELDSQKGERIKVSLDGESKLATPGASLVTFENISRGSHMATASVVSSGGGSLSSEVSVQFHIHRASVNN